MSQRTLVNAESPLQLADNANTCGGAGGGLDASAHQVVGHPFPARTPGK